MADTKSMIIFEHILTNTTIGISPEINGKYYHAMISALINSSDMGINSDRGQDFGYRLIPEQKAVIEAWAEDPRMIEKVSEYTSVPLDNLTDAEFLSYLLYTQNLGKSPERKSQAQLRAKQEEYAARVEAARQAMLDSETPIVPDVPDTTAEAEDAKLKKK